MTAQKTITVMGVFALLAAALLSAWSYARAGDPYSLVAAIIFALATAMAGVQLRRLGPSDSSSFDPAGAGRVIAKFIGFAAACWLLIFVRVRGDVSSLIDPLNVLVLVISFVALILGLYFALRLRESRRRQSS